MSVNLRHTSRMPCCIQWSHDVRDAGALIWHGSEMRRFRRLLSPPLQQLLAQPSIGTLGRGAASMAAELVSEVGACQALMHLATDAVQAAIESPFLEQVASRATGALCCVSLPSGKTSPPQSSVCLTCLISLLAMEGSPYMEPALPLLDATCWTQVQKNFVNNVNLLEF